MISKKTYTQVLHPSKIIPSNLVNSLRKYTHQNEGKKALSEPVLEIIYKQKWLKVLVPKVYGGAELSLPAAVQLFEALAWVDGNLGWCVNLGAGANMFSGYFDKATANEIFGQTTVCCAGSGAISGKALAAPGGYLLSGNWKYASGANHATHFTANAWLQYENGTPVMHNNEPVFKSFIVPADQVNNLHNWRAFGLKATSSNDFQIEKVFVPTEHTFDLTQPSAEANGTLYQFPFSLMAVTNMSCMATGLALHFLDVFFALATEKKPLHDKGTLAENPKVAQTISEVKQQIVQARLSMYSHLDSVWAAYENNVTPSPELLEATSCAFKSAASIAFTAIDRLYPLCGMSILDESSVLNKIWRDAHVASLHYLVSF